LTTTKDDDMDMKKDMEKELERKKKLIDDSFDPYSLDNKVLVKSRTGHVYKIKIEDQDYVLKMTSIFPEIPEIFTKDFTKEMKAYEYLSRV